MTCAELDGLLFEYVEGELEVAVRVRCAEHIEACPPCLVSVESYSATISFAKSLPKCQKPLDPGFEARLRTLLDGVS